MATTRQEQREDTSGTPPAPRGSTPPPQPPRFRFSRNWILFALIRLGVDAYGVTIHICDDLERVWGEDVWTAGRRWKPARQS